MDPLVGKCIADRYTLHRLVGKGAMGRVYLATDKRLHGRECAIKVLQAHDDEDERGRFERELRIVSLLRSPYVVQVLDSGVMEDGRPYIVMEFLVGNSLHQVIRRKGSLPPAEAISVTIDILQGLAEAHVYGIVHRDLKPANIFLCPTNDDRIQAKVLDFGVAKQLRGDDADITKTRASVGTPRYMAPEQFVQGQLSARTDLYGVGVLLFIMLTGRAPFIGDEEVPDAITDLPLSARLAWLHLYRAPPAVDGVSPQLAGLVAQLLDKKSGNRPPAARAVIERLRALPEAGGDGSPSALAADPAMLAPITESPTNPRPTKSIPRPSTARSKRGLWVILALVSIAGGVGAWLAGADDPIAPPMCEQGIASSPPGAEVWAADADGALIHRGSTPLTLRRVCAAETAIQLRLDGYGVARQTLDASSATWVEITLTALAEPPPIVDAALPAPDAAPVDAAPPAARPRAPEPVRPRRPAPKKPPSRVEKLRPTPPAAKSRPRAPDASTPSGPRELPF